MLGWDEAADIAQALLDSQGGDERVVRRATAVWENNGVFVFSYIPGRFDDTVLVVEKATGRASFQVDHILGPARFPDLKPVEGESEEDGDWDGPITIIYE